MRLEFSTFLTILCLVDWPSYCLELRAPKTIIPVSIGQPAELICAADSTYDTCKFYTPKGELVCSPEDPDLDCNPDLDDIDQSDAVEDYGNDYIVCKVTILSVSEEHYGDWNCQLEDFFDSTQGVVSLTRPGETIDYDDLVRPDFKEREFGIELRKVWGKIKMKVGKEVELTCDVFNEEDEDLLDKETPPGEAVWRMNGRDVAREKLVMDEDEGVWTSKKKLKANLETKEISCHLMKEQEDLGSTSVEVEPFLFEDLSGGDTLTCLNKTEQEEGCLLRVAFKANPWNGEDNIKWSLSDPSGQSVPLQLTNIESLQNSDEHMATLETSEVVQDGSILNLNFQGLYKKKYTIVEPAAEVEDIAQPDTATRSGVSLYIVIAIIVLVVGLCGCFYCCKCWRKKEDENGEAGGKDVEAARTCNARPPSTGFVNLGRNEDAAQAEEASQKRTETVETERKENAKSMEETAEELAKLLNETSEKDKVQDDNENDEKSEEGGNLLASNKPEVSLGSNGDKHEKASIQDGDEDKLLELREDEKDRGGVDTVDKAKRPESIPIPVMGSPKSPPSSPRQELLQDPVQRKREDSRTEVERQENAAALKTDKSPSRRRKERSPIPADWISEKKLRTSQPTEAVKESEFPANDRAEAERERKEEAKSMERRKSSTDDSSDPSDSEQCSDVDKSDVPPEEMPKTKAENGSEKSIGDASLKEPILKEEVPMNSTPERVRESYGTPSNETLRLPVPIMGKMKHIPVSPRVLKMVHSPGNESPLKFAEAQSQGTSKKDAKEIRVTVPIMGKLSPIPVKISDGKEPQVSTRFVARQGGEGDEEFPVGPFGPPLRNGQLNTEPPGDFVGHLNFAGEVGDSKSPPVTPGHKGGSSEGRNSVISSLEDIDEGLDNIIKSLNETDFGASAVSESGGQQNGSTSSSSSSPTQKEKEWMKSPIYKRSMERAASLEKRNSEEAHNPTGDD